MFTKTWIHGIANASHSGRAMEIIVFLTNSDVTSFDFTFIFIFLYEFMISDPLFHIERLLFFLCMCIYVYLYVCRLRYVLYVSPRF